MDFKEELKAYAVILSVLQDNFYAEAVYEIVKGLQGKKICYVTLDRPVASLTSSFRLRGIPLKDLFFVTSAAKDNDAPQVVKVSSWNDLSAVLQEILPADFDVLIWDSLGEMPLHLSTIIQKLKSGGKKAIFLCREENLHSPVVEKSYQDIDKVITFKGLSNLLQVKQRNQAAGALFILLLAVALPFLFGPEIAVTGLSIAQHSSRMLLLPLLLVLGLLLTAGIVLYQRLHKSAPKPLGVERRNSKAWHKKARQKVRHWAG